MSISWKLLFTIPQEKKKKKKKKKKKNIYIYIYIRNTNISNKSYSNYSLFHSELKFKN